MPSVWRIATDTPDYTADDPTGEGARRSGGRWNRAGLPVIYSSSSRALACLETLVHLQAGGLPFNRYLVRIDIPEPIWKKAERETADSLPPGWEAEPAGKVSIDRGSHWLSSGASCVLIVPSAIIPEEENILINPLHSAGKSLGFTKIRRWLYDPRLSGQG